MNRSQERNIAAILCYAVLAASTLALSEFLRKRGVPARLTRKLVHVTAGSSPLVILPLATDRWAGLFPYLLTIPMNLVLWRSRVLGSLDSEDRTPGIVYFPIAQSVLIAALWEPREPVSEHPTLFSALMALAWGDAMAALVGQSLGKHPYGHGEKVKSLEGSAAMFVTTGVAALLLHRGRAENALSRALLAATAATLAEGLTHRGLDNLAAPFAVALTLKTYGADARSTP